MAKWQIIFQLKIVKKKDQKINKCLTILSNLIAALILIKGCICYKLEHLFNALWTCIWFETTIAILIDNHKIHLLESQIMVNWLI
jgi:hypothetical protein